MRIVSLLPSTTEIIFDLGLGENLLGVTFECNFPSQAREGREIVVGGMDTHNLTPLEIDLLVRERVAAGEDMYQLDDAALARCNPDLILSQDLCRVCAVPSGEVDKAMERLNCDADVLQIDPHTLDEVIASVQTVAEAAKVPERGQVIVASLHRRLNELAKRTHAHLAGGKAPTVFILEWVEPPFIAGHWVPELVIAGGGEPILSRPKERSIATSWEQIQQAKPEHIIVAPCGYGLSEAVSQAQSVLSNLPASSVIWAIDADGVVVRPGPRLVDGAEAIAAALFGHEIAGLDKFPDHIIQRIR
jgi:iron complex transport system substrate-binding protein